jgi:hypothetical protein
VRRSYRIIAACGALACALPAAAHAGPGLLVGVADDSLKWTARPQAQAALGYTRDLGIRAVRVTVPWRAGETRLPLDQRGPVDRMILATWGRGLRVVLSVYGPASDAPQTGDQRDAYCAFAASLLRRYPGVNDVVIWNEPNSSRFWRPQFAPDGSSAAPTEYEALLARCWDGLHGVRPGVNVIAASAPRGNDRMSAGASHSPANFYRKLGEAYRQSGRNRPILDTVGHNPYPSSNAEHPWARHPRSKTIAEGDYETLMSVLEEAFGGTAQPVPGEGRVSIWYMEQGFQTTIDPAKASLYRGTETDRQTLPPWTAWGAGSASSGRLAPDQATQLSDALQLAYCQPAVGAFFNFELADEPNLAGWQSGLLWADLTPKPSYYAFKAAVRSVANGTVDCSRFSTGIGFTTPAAKPRSAPVK